MGDHGREGGMDKREMGCFSLMCSWERGEMSLADPIHLEEASTDGKPCGGKRARVAWYICGRLLLLQEYGKRPDLI